MNAHVNVYSRKSRNGKQKELICMYLRATIGEQTMDILLLICVTCFIFFIPSSVITHQKLECIRHRVLMAHFVYSVIYKFLTRCL